jgi:hypothetical protein
MLVVYDYDSNHNFVQPFRNRTAKCILDAYKIVHARLITAGLRPQLQRLDNECSAMLKYFLLQENVDFQLGPLAAIAAMPPNVQSTRSKIISLPASAALTPLSPFIFGTTSFHRRIFDARVPHQSQALRLGPNPWCF